MADRLISADALEKHCRNTKIIELFPEWKYFPYAMKIALIRYGKAWKEIIQNAPTVDAVEVVHGRWEMAVVPVCGEYNFRCSACKESFWRGYSYPDIAHYCPNCGAKMDGGSDDET